MPKMWCDPIPASAVMIDKSDVVSSGAMVDSPRTPPPASRKGSRESTVYGRSRVPSDAMDLEDRSPRRAWFQEDGRSPKKSSGDRTALRLGATLMPIRAGADGGLEVLCAQNTVLNYLKSEPGKHVLVDFPGEFRLLGALYKPAVDVTPLDTAIRGLTSAGLRNAQRYIRSYVAEREELGFAAMRAMLFDVTLQAGGAHKTFHFVCSMSRTASERLVNLLNQFLEAQQDCCDSKGDKLFEIPESLRAQLCPMFHRVSWWRIDELLNQSELDFVNEYQRVGLQAHGRAARSSGNAHLDMLRRLQKFTADQVFQQCILREQALLCVPKNCWSELQCGELEPCIQGCDGLNILSYNLNILPFGVASLRGHESLHSSARLQLFLAAVKGELEAEAGPREAGKDRVRAPDVIAVQELFASPFVPCFCAQSAAVSTMASLGYHAVIGPKPSVMDLLRRGKWTDSGLVIFSRLPIAETRSIRFESGAALDAGACKGAMWARVELASGRYLDVFNCHLQASHTGADGEVFDRIRRSQLKELREFIELAGTEHPYVLTGDFNVDAIPEPSDPMGTYGIPFRPPRQESEDYQRLLHSLDPRGRLVDLLCGPTPQDPLGKESPSFRRHPCTRPPRLRMPSSAGYVARHKYPQRLDYVFYRPTLTSLVEHAHSDVEPFEVSGQPFEYLSDHFGIRAHFRFRCSFAWARDPPKCKPNEPSLLRKAVDALWKRWFEGSLLLGLLPAAYLQVRKAELLQDVLRRPFSRLGVPLALQPTLLQYGFPLVCAGGCGLLLLFRRRLREEERPPLERTLSMTAELASSAFRRRLQAQSERPAKTIASSPYDSFNGSVESYRLRPCIGRRPLNSDGTLGEYTWLSYGDAQFEVLRISSGLHRKFGLKRNAQVGLLGDASADWLLCDLALMRLGANTVCLAAPASNPTSSTTAPVPSSVQDLELLLCSSDWVEYFVASRRNEELPRCPIVTFTPLTPRLAAMAQHRNLNVWDLPFIANFGEVAGWVPYVGVGGFDVMTTMYRSRSGTKSELAGVSVSLRGLAMCAHQIRQALGLRNDDRHFSYIWPAFTAERVVLHAVLAAGGAVGFFGGVRSPRIFEDIRRLQPTFLLGTASLFRRQITRLQTKHVGMLGNLSYQLQRWALSRCRVDSELPDMEGQLTGSDLPSASFMERVAKWCLTKPLSHWLNKPFVIPRHVLLGSKTRLRFVLALCGAGTTALPPDRCLWMRLLLGCPVLKSFVSVEAGGMVTLGEAPYYGDTFQAFSVGRELPGVEIEMLKLNLPEDFPPLSVLGSHEADIELGTLKVKGLATEEAKVGIVVGRRDQDLFVYGRLVSLQESSLKRGALCEALEQLLLQVTGPWLMQLLLVAKPQGVVGVAAVRLEEVWRLARFWSIDRASSSEDLCKDQRVISVCLRELHKHAAKFGFSDAEMPRALRLQATPFSLEAGLQTPTFQLRRDQLLPRVSHVIEELYDSLDGSPESQKDFIVERKRRGSFFSKKKSFPTLEWL